MCVRFNEPPAKRIHYLICFNCEAFCLHSDSGADADSLLSTSVLALRIELTMNFTIDSKIEFIMDYKRIASNWHGKIASNLP